MIVIFMDLLKTAALRISLREGCSHRTGSGLVSHLMHGGLIEVGFDFSSILQGATTWHSG